MWWRRIAAPGGGLPVVRVDGEVRTREGLRRRLAETAAWCEPRADAARPRDCLRNTSLQPRRLEAGYFETVSTVASSRQWQVRDCVAVDPSRGRLLVYFPDADLSDGAAEVESGGFFDVCNVPPWDTWVAFFQDAEHADESYARYLIAWVPPALVELATAGIEVNPEGCIAWLDDTRCAIRPVLSADPSTSR
jgi:hypothetical protein